MNILANEIFPGDAVSALRQSGHDEIWIRTDAPGISDIEVLQLAQKENRILITFEKDFGELAYRYGLPAQNGINLFRIRATSPMKIAQAAVAALESRDDWVGQFGVVEETRIRLTRLP